MIEKSPTDDEVCHIEVQMTKRLGAKGTTCGWNTTREWLDVLATSCRSEDRSRAPRAKDRLRVPFLLGIDIIFGYRKAHRRSENLRYASEDEVRVERSQHSHQQHNAVCPNGAGKTATDMVKSQKNVKRASVAATHRCIVIRKG